MFVGSAVGQGLEQGAQCPQGLELVPLSPVL